MLHTETVETGTLEILKQIMLDAHFSKFVLVGGTSLSLQLGHRKSVDLDLFCNESFDENSFVEYLRNTYQFELDFLDKETLKGEIEGVQIDCIAHKYPWLNSPNETDGIRLAHYEDIAAMKLNEIVGNDTRIKDFIDIAYLSKKMSLNRMLNAYQSKYSSNAVMVINALVYFDDINFNEPVKMIDTTKVDWQKIQKHLQRMIKNPDNIFEKIA